MPIHTKRLPRIAITPGEPAGIGPDIVVQLEKGIAHAELVVIADKELLKDRANMLDLPWNPKNFRNNARNNVTNASQLLTIKHVPLNTKAQPGHLNVNNSEYVLRTLKIACEGCLNGTYDALVTGPVHKGIINQAGFKFTGHTEWLAAHCGGYPVMVLQNEELRLALVTTHLPLSQVSAAITPQHLEQVIRILCQELIQRFGISEPWILISGLNPHAGEDGYLGLEESQIIEPVITKLQEEGLNLIGPLSADSLFIAPRFYGAAAVLVMYHDQGLPVIKHLGFGQIANVTLGLPIIRVSVDHGTALEIAGTGRARMDSLWYALKVATQLVIKRSEF